MDRTMLRRWWERHREIDQLVEAIRLELRRGSLAVTSVRIQRLATQLHDHLATEEELYFATIERASPLGAELLDCLRSDHRKLCQGIEELRGFVDNGDTTSARRALAVVLYRLYQYEVQELDLIVEFDALTHHTWPVDSRLH